MFLLAKPIFALANFNSRANKTHSSAKHRAGTDFCVRLTVHNQRWSLTIKEILAARAATVQKLPGVSHYIC